MSGCRKEPKKILTEATEQNGSQVTFYYGIPTAYLESIAPSLHLFWADAEHDNTNSTLYSVQPSC